MFEIVILSKSAPAKKELQKWGCGKKVDLSFWTAPFY